MGNTVSSTSTSWALSQTSPPLAASINPSTILAAPSPSTIVTVVRTADSPFSTCGSSGSPCCPPAGCSDYGPLPTTTTTLYPSTPCTDELSSLSSSSSSSTSAFTCLDWACLTSVIEAAGSSVCAADSPVKTSTVYYFTYACEYCPASTTTTTHTSWYHGSSTPDWPWPSTVCGDGDGYGGSCRSSSSSSSSSSWYRRRSSCSYGECAGATRSHFTAGAKCRPPHCRTLTTVPGAGVAESSGAEASGTR